MFEQKNHPFPVLLTLPVFAKELLAGGVAGMVGKSSVAPLERVKILYQTGAMRDLSILQMLNKILKQEGTLGLFKGNGASVVRIIPYSAIHFHAYEIFRRELTEREVPFLRERKHHGTPSVVHLMAGSAAGATAVIITYPLDVARTRLACMSEIDGKSWSWKSRLTIHSVLSGLVRDQGVGSLYRGIGPSLYGILPYAGLKFFVYQSLKGHYIRRMEPEHNRLPILVMLSFGGIAGLVGQTVSYPFDVVRHRMQAPEYSTELGPHHQPQKTKIYKSTFDELMKIVSSGGLKSLFSGLSINYVKVIPSTAIGFTTYDFMKTLLGMKHQL